MVSAITWMQAAEVDMTIFFRRLASETLDPVTTFLDAVYDADKSQRLEGDLRQWLERYQARVAGDGSAHDERRTRMNAANPLYVLRNYLAQEAIDRAEQGDESGVTELLEVMRRPYTTGPAVRCCRAVRKPRMTTGLVDRRTRCV